MSFFFCRNEKGLLNFVSEIIKLVFRINLLGTAFKKLSLISTSKTTIYRPHTSELKSISIVSIIVSLEELWKIYDLLYSCSSWNRTYKLWNTCDVPFAIAELGQKCLEAAPTLKIIWNLKQLHHCTQRFNHEEI